MRDLKFHSFNGYFYNPNIITNNHSELYADILIIKEQYFTHEILGTDLYFSELERIKKIKKNNPKIKLLFIAIGERENYYDFINIINILNFDKNDVFLLSQGISEVPDEQFIRFPIEFNLFPLLIENFVENRYVLLLERYPYFKYKEYNKEFKYYCSNRKPNTDRDLFDKLVLKKNNEGKYSYPAIDGNLSYHNHLENYRKSYTVFSFETAHSGETIHMTEKTLSCFSTNSLFFIFDYNNEIDFLKRKIGLNDFDDIFMDASKYRNSLYAKEDRIKYYSELFNKIVNLNMNDVSEIYNSSEVQDRLSNNYEVTRMFFDLPNLIQKFNTILS